MHVAAVRAWHSGKRVATHSATTPFAAPSCEGGEVSAIMGAASVCADAFPCLHDLRAGACACCGQVRGQQQRVLAEAVRAAADALAQPQPPRHNVLRVLRLGRCGLRAGDGGGRGAGRGPRACDAAGGAHELSTAACENDRQLLLRTNAPSADARRSARRDDALRRVAAAAAARMRRVRTPRALAAAARMGQLDASALKLCAGCGCMERALERRARDCVVPAMRDATVGRSARVCSATRSWRVALAHGLQRAGRTIIRAPFRLEK